MVVRADLVEKLVAAQAPVITVIAPPGYGKTTLLAQWAERIGPRVAWVSCDDGDNDPVVLLSALALALDRIEPVDPEIFQMLASSGAGITAVPRFVSGIAPMRRPVTVLLDHTEAVTNKQCLNMIAEFGLRLPPGWQLGLASRVKVPLPAARLRAQGGIFEITAEDLAMGPLEALSLLEGAGAAVSEVSIHDLLQRTEGWPAGLYIAALAMKSGTRQRRTDFTLTGDDVFMGDYLRSELLDRVSDAEVSFLTRTSVLDRMCGSLCDAVLVQKDSGRVLERMEGGNLLVVPLDRRREWYRYHHLLRELLHSELQRREPDLVQDLHFRAAAWFEANAMPETAIDHARAAGDYDRVARLLLDLAQPVWAGGRVETVLRWMEWLRDLTSAEHYGAIAVHGSLIFALLGQSGEAERWAAAAERASPTGILPDGSTMESTLAYLRAILCRDGVAEMRRNAQIAWDGLSPASPYRATMLYTEGISYLLEGDPARTGPILTRAYDVATNAGALPLAALILAEQCNVAADLGNWQQATALARRAVEIVEAGHFEDYWTSALVYAWAARAAVHDGRHRTCAVLPGACLPAEAPAHLRPSRRFGSGARRDGPLLYRACRPPGRCGGSDASPRHPPAKARPRRPPSAGRPAGVQTRDDQGQGCRCIVTDCGRNAAPAAPVYASLVPGDGERLFVSSHTVKTQAYSVYRKLGVSSRSEAVDRVHELGLNLS